MEEKVKEILYNSFRDNKSIHFMIGNDNKSDKRFRYLLKYSYEKTKLFGKVFYNDNIGACALVLDSRKKRFSIKSILLDIGLVINVIGLKRLKSVLKRESLIQDFHPKGEFIHIWYIGVQPNLQGKGNGSILMKNIFAEYRSMEFYLETSNIDNIPFYEKHGFLQKALLKLDKYNMLMLHK